MTAETGWDRDTSPYHRGEAELHERLGIKDRQEATGRRIHRPYMPEQHREFFAQLPFLIVGSVDDDGRPWASMVFGREGFVASPTARSLRVAARPVEGDPLAANIAAGRPVAFLGIELPTRRRNRMNGVVSAVTSEAFDVDVVQSFGNCPQYIQTRAPEFLRDPNDAPDIVRERFDELDAETAELIASADTLFVSSFNGADDIRDTGGVDVNHRGGRSGFVKVDGNTLTIPDYVGNFAFNTLGNFLVNPRAGLLFVDFDSGDLVMLTGSTEVIWDKTPEVRALRGAERAWRFTLEQGIRLRNASPLKFAFDEYSPNTLLTGDWAQAAASLEQAQRRDAWQPLRVAEVRDESRSIRSFYLEPADDGERFDYRPGQYLPIRVRDGAGKPLIRTYTLSSSPTDDRYRISVKREQGGNGPDGVVSNRLHDTLAPGVTLEAMAPRGTFVFDPMATRPAVLIAAGVGVTPMVSMVRAAALEGFRKRHLRPLTIIHSARTTAERAFARELDSICGASSGAFRYLSVITRPADGEREGVNFHYGGRLTAERLGGLLPGADADVYLCGPAGFMQSMYDALTELGVDDKRIFAESFGPSTLTRRGVEAQPAVATGEEADSAVVAFANAGFEQPWTPEEGTLLEFAERHGLYPNFACRNGICGTCAVRLRRGRIHYRTQPIAEAGSDEVFICCATPAESDEGLELEL